MDPLEFATSLAVALGVGLMIGLQREQSALEAGTESAGSLGGIRTYPLFAVVGAVSTVLSGVLGMWIVAIVFIAMTALLAIAYREDVRSSRDRGLTSEAAFMATFLLGALAMQPGLFATAKDRWLSVASLGVVVTALLSLKKPLHAWVARVTSEDVFATVKFLVVAIVVLPLLPDHPMGPAKALNPYKIGLMVTLVASISFVGFVAFRVLGAGKGLGLTGLVGGLASSTAVTLSMSGLSKRDPSIAGACAMGTVLASTVMAGRVLALVAAFNAALVPLAAVPIGAMLVAGLVFTLLTYLRVGRTAAPADGVKIGNPFELASALKMGLVFAVVLVVTKVASEKFGSAGFYVAAVLSGFTDVDAITLSAIRMAADGSLGAPQAVTGILVACVANTVAKLFLAVSLGAPGYRGRVAVAFGAMAAAGALGLVFAWR